MTPAAVSTTVLITGCSEGGIGDALARSFHQKGLRVFATARDLSKVKHLQEMGITVLLLDVADSSSIKRAVEDVKEATGGTLDILVNNSGVGYSSPILDADLVYARKAMDVNLFGRVATTQAFAPLLIRSRGTIVNIGSIAGVYPSIWNGMYGATCAAVNQWSETLRIELEPLGIKVVLVVTGAVRTRFLENLPTTHLVEGSLYSPARDAIEAVMNATSFEHNFASVNGYAEQVVCNALKASPKKRQWAGGMASLIWLASTLLWATAWDFVLAGQFGITELKRKLKVGK